MRSSLQFGIILFYCDLLGALSLHRAALFFLESASDLPSSTHLIGPVHHPSLMSSSPQVRGFWRCMENVLDFVRRSFPMGTDDGADGLCLS